MDEFVFAVPTRAFFGYDVLTRIGPLVAGYGKRALLVTESAGMEGDYPERVRDSLIRKGIDCIVYDELIPDTAPLVIDRVVSMARASQSQVVIGLGGMRVSFVARCAALLATGRRSMADIVHGAPTPDTFLPYIEVPVSCRNHMMLSNTCVVTVEQSRAPMMIRLPVGLVQAVLIDPKFFMSVSPAYTAAAILDALLGSVEGFISKHSNFLSDVHLLKAVNRLGKAAGILAQSPQDIKSRVASAEGGLALAVGLAMVGQGPGSALAYAINSRFDVPKSSVAAILLPHVVDFFTTARAEKTGRIANALGEEEDAITTAEAALSAPVAVRRIIARLGVPARLRDLDLDIESLYDCAEAAAELEMISNVPIPVAAPELYDILKRAY